MMKCANSIATMEPKTENYRIVLSRTWAIFFWVATLAETCIRLGFRALEPFRSPEYILTWGHYLFLVIWCIAMIIFGSYRGFHKQFSPRLVARTVLGLSKSSPWWFHIPLVSPLMAAGFLHATRNRLLHSWILLVWIIFAVVMCQLTPQPWRSFIDAGVVCRSPPFPPAPAPLTFGTADFAACKISRSNTGRSRCGPTRDLAMLAQLWVGCHLRRLVRRRRRAHRHHPSHLPRLPARPRRRRCHACRPWPQ
jgi:hypothetical protein